MSPLIQNHPSVECDAKVKLDDVRASMSVQLCIFGLDGPANSDTRGFKQITVQQLQYTIIPAK